VAVTHEIVKALEPHPKAISWEFETGFPLVMGLEV
jgi:hypothetical protein